MTIDCILMISIFQQAFPLDPEGDVEDYIALFAPEIDRLGRVLKFLGLAERAPKSRIMWKPTLQLLTLIGQKLTQPPVKLKCTVTDGDREFVQAFILRDTGDTRPTSLEEAFEFCCSVLAALGLLQQDASGGYKPTHRLHAIMLDRFLQSQPVHAVRT